MEKEKWHSLSDYSADVLPIFYLAQLGRVDLDVRKGRVKGVR
ncbi:hypothetical protein OAL33_02565 [Akkermansiaceae bacterium]|nr:hypothetical protein [Akkermansiaceae bacterium]MDB4333908.1 hypothetical protein [Akkermansiaceae bacterium]MDC0289129.1 hypothetical protein [Akkermansiaceae bacterium]MDC0323451.1 hypothetical protein [Akkermansiaceae bacterium]